MRKEIIIVFIIIIMIFATDILTQNFTKKSISLINEKLDNIKTSIINNETNDLNSEIKNSLVLGFSGVLSLIGKSVIDFSLKE